MEDLLYDTEDDIMALATPWAESAIAIIRISGKTCLETFAPLFSRSKTLLESPGAQILHGKVLDAQGTVLDEVNLNVFRSPKSYTGQDSLEINCHGSLPGVQRILTALQSSGFRQAGPGEFTLRAFLNKKMDLTRAEAVAEIIGAKSQQAQSLALHRLGGGITALVDEMKKRLLDLVSHVNIQLDYAEDDVEDLDFPLEGLEGVLAGISRLLGTYNAGRVFQEGVRIVLAGKTNAGKSSLFNLFLKEDRSIVSDIHGTTRDYLESWISLGGIPVRLYDTAGLREAEDLVEQEGIRRTKGIMENAQLILYIVDGTSGVSPEDTKEIKLLDREERLIRIWNKADQAPSLVPEGFLPLSALTGEGFNLLEEKIKSLLLKGVQVSPGDVVIDSLRQKLLLVKAKEALLAVQGGLAMGMSLDTVALDLREALDALGEITGEVTTTDVLSNMFSNFCVGK